MVRSNALFCWHRIFVGMIVSLAIFSIRLYSQEPEQLPLPTLRFGIEIKVINIGVEIADITSDRPVSRKLKKGDVMRSYEVADRPGEQKRIASGRDIDDMKSALADGQTVILNLFRPNQDEGMLFYVPISVTLDASDLLTPPMMAPGVAVTKTYSATAEPANTPNKEVLVSVFYATDRRLENGVYTGRIDESDKPVKYGVATVSIPPTHQPGQLEGPVFWKMEFRENPARHIVIRSVSQFGKEDTFIAMAGHFEAMQSVPKKRVLVFVHGYNVAFDEAAKRAAQLHYDLNFPGVTMFYSWPSDGTLTGYVSDAADVDWSVFNMKTFLADLEQQSIDEIYLLAHSMGNRGLTRALVDLRRDGGGKKIRELILAAPDIDARIFTRDIAPALSFVPNTTVYASSSDKALWSSYTISSAPRVGEIRNGEPTIAGTSKMAVIDVSTVKSDIVGHSAYGSASIVTDIGNIVKGLRLPRPHIKPVAGTRGPYWEFDQD